MMNKKVFVKLIALLMAAAMLLGVCACSCHYEASYDLC